MQYNQLITDIQADIYSNGAELITGDILQNVLVAMVGALASAGACYKGTITPASAAPLDLDQPTVYLALTAGTYTNFVDSNNDPIVTTGPALITYDGGPSLVFTKTDLPSGSPDAVLYTPQTLTDPQKTQARENIEAAHAVRITNANISSKPYLYIAIPVDSQELNLRIDVVAHNTSGDKIGYTGSLILALNDDEGGGVWTGRQAYYYGDDLALLFSSIAIDVYGDYYLVLACESSNDDITLTIYPTTETEIAATWYASRPGTEEDTITPSVIGAGSSDVFWATYGTTTATEISNAITAGKAVMCQYNNGLYYYSRADATYHYLVHLYGSIQYVQLRVRISDSVWSNVTSGVQTISNRTSDITTDPTSVTTYPNNKAITDYAQRKWREQTIEVTDEATDRITFTADANATELEFDILISYNQTTANYLFCCPDPALHGSDQDAFARPQIAANVVYFKMTARCIKLGTSFMSQGVSGTGSVLADIIGFTSQLWQCPSGRTFTQNFASITFGFNNGNKYLGIGSKITIRYR